MKKNTILVAAIATVVSLSSCQKSANKGITSEKIKSETQSVNKVCSQELTGDWVTFDDPERNNYVSGFIYAYGDGFTLKADNTSDQLNYYGNGAVTYYSGSASWSFDGETLTFTSSGYGPLVASPISFTVSGYTETGVTGTEITLTETEGPNVGQVLYASKL